MQMPKEKLQKIILVGIISLAASAAIHLFYVSKGIEVSQQGSDKIAELERKINASQAQAKQSSQLAQNRAVIAAFVDAQRVTMVTGDPFSWCVRQISLLGEKHPVRILSIRPGARGRHARKELFETFEVQIEVEGNYDQLGVFVREFENHFTTAEILKLDMTTPSTTSTDRRINMNVSFLVKPERTGGKDKSAAPSKKEVNKAA